MANAQKLPENVQKQVDSIRRIATTLISTIILIIVVLFLFGPTIRTYYRERSQYNWIKTSAIVSNVIKHNQSTFFTNKTLYDIEYTYNDSNNVSHTTTLEGLNSRKRIGDKATLLVDESDSTHILTTWPSLPLLFYTLSSLIIVSLLRFPLSLFFIFFIKKRKKQRQN